MIYFECVFDKPIFEKAIAKWGGKAQTVVAIEEMAELTHELTRSLRGEDRHDQLVEELADVYIMLNQIEMIYDIKGGELKAMVRKKTDRLDERLKGIRRGPGNVEGLEDEDVRESE